MKMNFRGICELKDLNTIVEVLENTGSIFEVSQQAEVISPGAASSKSKRKTDHEYCGGKKIKDLPGLEVVMRAIRAKPGFTISIDELSDYAHKNWNYALTSMPNYAAQLVNVKVLTRKGGQYTLNPQYQRGEALPDIPKRVRSKKK